MLLVNPIIAMTGVSIAFFQSTLVPLMVLQQENDPKYIDTTDTEKSANALFALVFLGVGEVIGGILEGFLIDKCGNKPAIIINILVIVSAILTACYNCWQLRFGYMSYAMTGLWGLVDASINIFTFRMLGFEFESKSIPFGTFGFIQGVTVFMCDTILTMLDDKNWKHLMGFSAGVGIMGVFAWVLLLTFPFKKRKGLTRSELLGRH